MRRRSVYEGRTNFSIKPSYSVTCFKEDMCSRRSCQLISLTHSLSKGFVLKNLKIGDIARAVNWRTNVGRIFRLNQLIMYVSKKICVAGEVFNLYRSVTVCLGSSFKKVLKFAILHVPFLRFTEVDFGISSDFRKAQTILFRGASRKMPKKCFL